MISTTLKQRLCGVMRSGQQPQNRSLQHTPDDVQRENSYAQSFTSERIEASAEAIVTSVHEPRMQEIMVDSRSLGTDEKHEASMRAVRGALQPSLRSCAFSWARM